MNKNGVILGMCFALAMPSLAAATKEQDHATMVALAEQMRQARAAGDEATYEALFLQYSALSQQLGGCLSGQAYGEPDSESVPGGNVVPPPPVGCIPTTTVLTNNTPVVIPAAGANTVTSTIVVAGEGPYLYDLDLQTFITHSFNSDLDISLTSPAGTIVSLATDLGGSFDNVFNGTLWDDDANPGGPVPYTSNNGVASDTVYANLVLASPLVPEEAMAAFVGEDPNGTWTLTVADQFNLDGGLINSWSMSLTTLAAAPITAPVSATNNTPVVIPAAGANTVTSTIVIAGAGTSILDVNATTFITHSFNSDLDISLTSPAGTIVSLATDLGGSFDNVFNGTLWDDDANPGGPVPYTSNNGVASDTVYANLVLASPLVPEEAMGAFIGEDPNGTWTLTVADQFNLDGGLINSWTLDIVTGSCPVGCTLTLDCPANQQVNAPPGAQSTTVTYPAPIAGGTCVAPVIACFPASGSAFPLGTTTVVCTATDPNANATCTFDVTVGETTIQEIPTVSRLGLVLLAALVAAAAFVALKLRH